MRERLGCCMTFLVKDHNSVQSVLCSQVFIFLWQNYLVSLGRHMFLRWTTQELAVLNCWCKSLHTSLKRLLLLPTLLPFVLPTRVLVCTFSATIRMRNALYSLFSYVTMWNSCEDIRLHSLGLFISNSQVFPLWSEHRRCIRCHCHYLNILLFIIDSILIVPFPGLGRFASSWALWPTFTLSVLVNHTRAIWRISGCPVSNRGMRLHLSRDTSIRWHIVGQIRARLYIHEIILVRWVLNLLNLLITALICDRELCNMLIVIRFRLMVASFMALMWSSCLHLVSFIVKERILLL